MRVQRVLMPGSAIESWTVLGDDLVPVSAVEQYLAYLTSVERSPNTVKAYAHDLKDWLGYLATCGLDWRVVSLEEAGGFVAWLRLPPAARAGSIAALPSVVDHCGNASVQRKLAAVTSFYDFHARRGVNPPPLVDTVQRRGRRLPRSSSFTPFLAHVAKGKPVRRRLITLKTAKPRPKILTPTETQSILDTCVHLRDRLLFALLLDTGIRIGEALGLRHEDLNVAERTVSVIPRRNDNRARAKSGIARTIPTSPELMRLYADYLNREYGAIDSDYVFINLWSAPVGHPWAYPAVYDLVGRLRERTGIDFEPHQFRHTYATWLLRRGAGVESVQQLLGHSSITTTVDTYGHLTVEDARETLDAAGWFTGREVRL